MMAEYRDVFEGEMQMLILLSLALAFSAAWFGARAIKKYAAWFYAGAAAAAVAVVWIAWTGAYAGFPQWARDWLWPLFSRGALATALFIVVMFTGALPNGSSAIRRLMPVRAELSIIASFLTLGHNIAFGRTYFVRLFTAPEQLPAPLLLAAICSALMIAILLPLLITSFRAVRRKMRPRAWKKLQRTAYAFYALIYLHVMLLYVPLYQQGNRGYLANILAYTLIFFAYAAMRLRKALMRRQPGAARAVPIACAALALAVCVLAGVPWKEVPPERALAEALWKDGVYTGEGMGHNGKISVEVEIVGGRIKRITPLENSEDVPYWQKAEGLIGSILEQQSTQVEAVSGATYSSEGLRQAVADALAKMGER